MAELNLFEYTDYRRYLKDFYSSQKQASASFSFRVFALRAKLSSPNYLKLVIDGQRRITDKNLPNFIRGLKLSRHQADYFRNLVFYQEADDVEAKTMHLRELIKIRGRVSREAKTLERDRFEILRTWHPWVIREMVLLSDFRPDPEWIARRLRNKITPTEAADALALLERLEFIRREGETYKVSEPLITTGDDISLLLLNNLHRQFFEFAIQSVMNDVGTEKAVSGVTIAIPSSRLPEVKTVVREFRQEFNRRFSSSEGNDSVYHLSIAVFPLTKSG